jgi:hypothetical protein
VSGGSSSGEHTRMPSWDSYTSPQGRASMSPTSVGVDSAPAVHQALQHGMQADMITPPVRRAAWDAAGAAHPPVSVMGLLNNTLDDVINLILDSVQADTSTHWCHCRGLSGSGTGDKQGCVHAHAHARVFAGSGPCYTAAQGLVLAKLWGAIVNTASPCTATNTEPAQSVPPTT